MTVTTPIAFLKAEFNGRNGTGTISVPGLKAGDAVILNGINNRQNEFPFEAIISTDDQITQWYNGDLSSDDVVLVLMRGV